VAIQASKLDIAIAGVMGRLLSGFDPFIVLVLISLLGIVFTAFIANTAACAVLMPMMLPLAPALGLGVRQLGLTLGIVSSFDFTVPVGTPPNALAYSSGYVRVKDMAKAGLMLSLVSALAVSALAAFYW
jgi:sodium-dependent dicarboxylate transporter 2/3/5